MNTIQQIDGKKLLVPERLDLIIKYLYIDAYMNNRPEQYADLYKRHIAVRTGGKEDHKNGLHDFLLDFHRLIESFKDKGFESRYPIPVSKKNGILMDGAHRAACSLYFQEEVFVEYRDGEGLPWDWKWLYLNGFREDLPDILKTYVRLKENHAFLAILPAEAGSALTEKGEEFIAPFQLVGKVEIKLTEEERETIGREALLSEREQGFSEHFAEILSFLRSCPEKIAVFLFHLQAPTYVKEKAANICLEAWSMKEKLMRELLLPDGCFCMAVHKREAKLLSELFFGAASRRKKNIWRYKANGFLQIYVTSPLKHRLLYKIKKFLANSQSETVRKLLKKAGKIS